MKVSLDESKLMLMLYDKIQKYSQEGEKRFNELNKDLKPKEKIFGDELAQKIKDYEDIGVEQKDWDKEIIEETKKGWDRVKELTLASNFELFTIEEIMEIFTITKEDIMKTIFNKEEYANQKQF